MKIAHTSLAVKPSDAPKPAKPAMPIYTNPAKLIENAQAFLASKNFNEAQTLLNSILQENPLDPKALSLYLQACSSSGQLQNAVARFERYIRSGTAHPAVYAAMINAYCAAGEVFKARALLSAAISRKVASSEAFCSMIDAYGRLGRMNEAKEIADLAVSKGFEVSTHLAAAYIQGKDSEKAYRIFAGLWAKAKSPALAGTFLDMFAKAGDLKMARNVLELSIASRCCDEKICHKMLRYCFDQGNNVAASHILDFLSYRKLCTIQLCKSVLFEYLDASQSSIARSAFDIFAAKRMADKEMVSRMLCEYAKKGDFEGASRIINDVANRVFVDPYALGEVTRVLYGKKMFKELLEFLDSLPKTLMESPFAMTKRADALRKVKRFDEAIAVLKETIKNNHMTEKQKCRAEIILAFCLKDSGNAREAFTMLDDVLKRIHPDSHLFARATCGYIFAWQELSFGPEIEKEMRDFLLSSLKPLRRDTNPNMNRDIGDAIAILERKR